MSRTFEVIHVETKSGRVKGKENLGGHFTGESPSQAARKAGTQICRASSIKGQCTLVITVREMTRGSDHKNYTYEIKRVKLDEPKSIMRGDSEIIYEYKMSCRSMN